MGKKTTQKKKDVEGGRGGEEVGNSSSERAHFKKKNVLCLSQSKTPWFGLRGKDG